MLLAEKREGANPAVNDVPAAFRIAIPPWYIYETVPCLAGKKNLTNI
jgi:hypothetical protein